MAFLRHHNIHIAALPEVHVNQSSAPGFVRQWKYHGFHAALAECGPDAHSCVGLVSSEPFKQVQLCVGPGRVRHVAGLFTACASSALNEESGQSAEGLLIIAFYGQSGNHIAAEAQIEDVIAAAEGSGFRWACVGDFNLLQHEGVLGSAGVNGAIHLLDDCADGAPLPGTGPSGTRRIDFGVSQWSIRATQVSHLSTDLSDHTVVVYNIPWAPGMPQLLMWVRVDLKSVLPLGTISQRSICSATLSPSKRPAKRVITKRHGPGSRIMLRHPYVNTKSMSVSTGLSIGNRVNCLGELTPNGRTVPSQDCAG